ncbi:MAG: hypothetical protein ACK5M1_14925 [Xanthomarina gelatinilytica]
MATNFNSDNPERLVYENDILQLTVLGGIKLGRTGQDAKHPKSTVTTK